MSLVNPSSIRLSTNVILYINYNVNYSTSSNPQHNALEACESLLILMKEADVDQRSQEDIACMMMQNCFLDFTLKAKLSAVKTPTRASFNVIIKSHKAGKKATNAFASANAVNGKGRR